MKDKRLKIKDLQFKDLDWLIQEVTKEGERQVGKFGVQEVSPFEWLAWVGEEFGELSKAIIKYTRYNDVEVTNVITEAIQVSTLALKIAEMYGEKLE